MDTIFETNCPDLPIPIRGKVRDIIDLGAHYLQVATDRLSALDVVSQQPVPGKGKVLTDVSVFWFKFFAQRLPWLKSHFVTADWNEIVAMYPQLAPYANQLAGRSILTLKADRILAIEAIVRGVLYGSGWKDYLKTGEVCGIKLPEGMLLAQTLEWPMFTPSTKAPAGQHDANISVVQAIELGLVAPLEVSSVAAVSTLMFELGRQEALKRGVILADTKFEFGMLNGELLLADEILTPDSSRYWPADGYVPGIDPPSLDKQPIRIYLEELAAKGEWNKKAPMPTLPDEVIAQTSERYEKLRCLFCN